MKTIAIFNDDVAYDLGLSLNDLYVIGYIHSIRNTNLVKTKIIGNEECFTFNLVNLFKARPLIFDKVKLDESMSDEDKEAYLNKMYDMNRKRFNRMIKSTLGKVLVKVKTVNIKDGKETYYRLNKSVMTVLINGYAKSTDTELTENEKLICKATGIFDIAKGTRTQLKSMETDTLKASIEVAKEKGILDFPYIKRIYNNLIENKKVDVAPTTPTDKTIENNNVDNSIPGNSRKYTRNNCKDYKKTGFHNFNSENGDKSVEELDAEIERAMENKWR